MRVAVARHDRLLLAWSLHGKGAALLDSFLVSGEDRREGLLRRRRVVRAGDSARWLGLVCLLIGSLAVVATAAASGTALPSACAVLTKAHPEKAFGHGRVLVVSHHKAQKFGTGAATILVCSETVGRQSVSLSLSSSGGGFGGVKVISQTHPSGLGSGDTLTVGTSPTGSPVDFISFHRGGVFAVITANGAVPSLLTAFARTIYKLL